MEPEDLKFLMDEFEELRKQHDWHIKEAKKCLRGMVGIQNELLCGAGDGSK
jgi:hypothetical protein